MPVPCQLCVMEARQGFTAPCQPPQGRRRMEHAPDAPLSMLRGHPFQQSYNAGTPVHSVKLEAEFQSPLEHLLALAAEFDLQTLWNKACPLPGPLSPARWLRNKPGQGRCCGSGSGDRAP